jgi:hypothetical protein
MKKIIFLGWLVVFLPTMICAQERIETPVWNVGDKWVFNREGPMEVTGIDKTGYVVKFSGGIFLKSLIGTAIFDKSTLNIIYLLKDNKPSKYTRTGPRKTIFNFPLTIGKKWKDSYSRVLTASGWNIEYSEEFWVMGWENVEVRAGKFKTVKLEYKLDSYHPTGHASGPRGKVWYWYAPEAKNFVKCQYEKGYTEGEDEREDWELNSLQLKK